jgi:hypothetical protein
MSCQSVFQFSAILFAFEMPLIPRVKQLYWWYRRSLSKWPSGLLVHAMHHLILYWAFSHTMLHSCSSRFTRQPIFTLKSLGQPDLFYQHLLGLLRLNLPSLFPILLSDGFDHTFVDLTILVDSRVIDSVDPSLFSLAHYLHPIFRGGQRERRWLVGLTYLIEEDDKDCVISETC